MSSLWGTAMILIAGTELAARDEAVRDTVEHRIFQEVLSAAQERQRQYAAERDTVDALHAKRVIRFSNGEAITPLSAHSPQDGDEESQPKAFKPSSSSGSSIADLSDFSMIEAPDADVNGDAQSSSARSEVVSLASNSSRPNSPRFSLDGFVDAALYSPDRIKIKRRSYSLPDLPEDSTDWGSLERPKPLPIIPAGVIWPNNCQSETFGPDSEHVRGVRRFESDSKIELEEIKERLLEEAKRPAIWSTFMADGGLGPRHPLETMYYLRLHQVTQEKLISRELSLEEAESFFAKLWRELQKDVLNTIASTKAKLEAAKYSRTITRDGCVITKGFGPAPAPTPRELRAATMSWANKELAQAIADGALLSPTKRPRRVTFDASTIDPPEGSKLEAARPLRRSLSDLTHVEKAAIAARNQALDAEDAVDSDDDYNSETSDMSYDTESDCSGYDISPMRRMPSRELPPPAKTILKISPRTAGADSSYEHKYDANKPMLAPAARFVARPTLEMSKSFSAQLEAEETFAELEQAGILKPVGENDFVITTAEYDSTSDDLPEPTLASGAIMDGNDSPPGAPIVDQDPFITHAPALAAGNEKHINSDSGVAMPDDEKTPASHIHTRVIRFTDEEVVSSLKHTV